MNNQFDELTKILAQSVTRRAALKKFSIGVAGMALACFGFARKTHAGSCRGLDAPCKTHFECCSGFCNGLFSSRRGRCASPF